MFFDQNNVLKIEFKYKNINRNTNKFQDCIVVVVDDVEFVERIEKGVET